MEFAGFGDRLLRAIIFWAAAALTYFLMPHLTFFGTNYMPYTTLDDAIPFLPWTSLIYFTLYPQVFVAFALAGNRLILNKLFLVYMIAMGLLAFGYWLFPTVHEYRPNLDGLSLYGFERVVQWLRSLDVSGNQFPSGHAIYSMIGPVFYLAMGHSKSGFFLLLWSILLALSAITTKQHNAMDVFFSWPLAILLGLIFGKIVLKSFKRFGPKQA